MLLKQPLLQLNTPTKDTGLIYTVAVLRDAGVLVPGKTIYGDIKYNAYSAAGLNINHVAFIITNLVIDGNLLLGDVRLLTTPYGEVLKALPTTEYQFSLSCAQQWNAHTKVVTKLLIIKGTAFLKLIEYGLNENT